MRHSVGSARDKHSRSVRRVRPPCRLLESATLLAHVHTQLYIQCPCLLLVQNAYAESFNGRLRDECLNANWFASLSDARWKIETRRQHYNEQRPHSSLKYLPP